MPGAPSPLPLNPLDPAATVVNLVLSAGANKLLGKEEGEVRVTVPAEKVTGMLSAGAEVKLTVPAQPRGKAAVANPAQPREELGGIDGSNRVCARSPEDDTRRLPATPAVFGGGRVFIMPRQGPTGIPAPSTLQSKTHAMTREKSEVKVP